MRLNAEEISRGAAGDAPSSPKASLMPYVSRARRPALFRYYRVHRLIYITPAISSSYIGDRRDTPRSGAI